MIVTSRGNILRTSTTYNALVNPVNCIGVMGKGLALQFKELYPKNYTAYKKACELRQVKIGECWVFERDPIVNPKFIINFPTKQHWHDNSKIEDIKAGLEDLAFVVYTLKINSIAIPALGCGLGQLRWLDVKPLIEETFSKMEDVDVIMFEPF